MGTGGKDELVTIGHQWHPGRLLYYNRAELKQSDHRWVVLVAKCAFMFLRNYSEMNEEFL